MKATQLNLPLVFSINSKEQWYIEAPSSTYQGTDPEELFLLLCDLYLSVIYDLDENQSIISSTILETKTPDLHLNKQKT